MDLIIKILSILRLFLNVETIVGKMISSQDPEALKWLTSKT